MAEQKYYKFLSYNLKCNTDQEFYYPMPTFKDGKWTPTDWITTECDKESKESCGKGLHLLKIPKPMYGRFTGNVFLAEGKNILGEDNLKARFEYVRLIRPLKMEEIFFSRANLSDANLSDANLSRANLSGANLSGANLYGANLSEKQNKEAIFK